MCLAKTASVVKRLPGALAETASVVERLSGALAETASVVKGLSGVLADPIAEFRLVSLRGERFWRKRHEQLAALRFALSKIRQGFDQVLAPQPTDVSPGNEVLGQIFGSKDVSRTVAQNASSQTGLDPSLLKKMLPMLAMLVAGFMAKRQSAGAQPSSAGGGLGELLGGLLGGRAADADDGNPLDDILRMAGKAMR